MGVPALAYRDPLGGRGYKHPVSGVKVPSITTVIGLMNKPFLVPAAAKLNAEYALKNWDDLTKMLEPDRLEAVKNHYRREWYGKADIGTRVHDFAEAWARNQALPPVTPDIEAQVAGFVQFLEDYKVRFVWMEATVWSETHGYAGTLDFIAYLTFPDGAERLVIGDYKTGKALYPELGMQLAAGYKADYIITPAGKQHEIPEVEGAVGVHITPKGYQVVPVRMLDESFEVFLGLLQATRFKDFDKQVLGEPYRFDAEVKEAA